MYVTKFLIVCVTIVAPNDAGMHWRIQEHVEVVYRPYIGFEYCKLSPRLETIGPNAWKGRSIEWTQKIFLTTGQ